MWMQISENRHKDSHKIILPKTVETKALNKISKSPKTIKSSRSNV